MRRVRQGDDPRDVPAYTFREAAQYLRVPVSTLRSWTVGRNYPVAEGERRFRPLVGFARSRAGTPILTFNQLVEVHVLDALRRHHQVSLDKIRKALDYVERQLRLPRPLLNERFLTDGVGIFVERFNQLVEASRDGQIGMREALEIHLQRVEHDAHGLAFRFYPFTRLERSLDEPRVVLIDPRISFGRPVLAGSGIPTAELASRFRAGESLTSLAKDFERPAEEIEEAIRCEFQEAA